MPGWLFFTATRERRYVQVRRDVDVPDDFWRKLRSEWGQRGHEPSVAIIVPIETFLARKNWLPGSCREFGVQVQVDDDVRSVLERNRQDQDNLDEARSHSTSLDSAETLDRIRGTRFTRELKDFQVRDLGKLLSLAHGANFSVPG